MSEWKEIKLREVVSSNRRSISYGYPYKTIKYLDTGSITRGKIEGFQDFNLPDAPSRAKRLVKNKDIIYSTVRPIQRHYGFIINPPENLVVSTGFSVIETNKEKADPLFIYYFLTSDEIVETLDVIADGSTSAYPSLKPTDIENLDIIIPPLPEQKAIAAVLSSLDDKIDLLHRQNKTLEALAETLFRQWFVEPFDNAQGREARDDWEEGKLGEILTVKGGTTPSTKVKEYWDGDINWTAPRDLSNNPHIFIFDTARKITKKGLEKISSGLLPIGTILLSSRAPIGYIAITEIPLAINQGYIAILDNKGFSKYFLYLWIKANLDYIISNANGSVFPEISKSVFRSLEIQKPPSSLRLEFENQIIPLFEKIRANSYQIRTLGKMRDTLLPKLMSGDIRVKTHGRASQP